MYNTLLTQHHTYTYATHTNPKTDIMTWKVGIVFPHWFRKTNFRCRLLAHFDVRLFDTLTEWLAGWLAGWVVIWKCASVEFITLNVWQTRINRGNVCTFSGKLAIHFLHTWYADTEIPPIHQKTSLSHSSAKSHNQHILFVNVFSCYLWTGKKKFHSLRSDINAKIANVCLSISEILSYICCSISANAFTRSNVYFLKI